MDPAVIAIIGGLGGMFFWGTTDVFGKKAVDVLGNKVSTAYFVLMTLVMAFPLLLVDTILPEFSANTVFQILIYGVADFLALFFLMGAFAKGKVSVVNPITAAWAALAAVVSFVVFDEVFTVTKTILIGITLLGILLVSVSWRQLRDGFQEGDVSKGVPEAIFCFLVYGFYVPFFDQLLSNDGWVWIVLLVRLVTSIVTVSFMYWQIGNKLLPHHQPSLAFKWIIIAGLLQGIGANLFNWALSAGNDTAITATLASGYPAVLVVLSYIFLKERLALNQYFGVAIIVTAIVLLSLS